VSVADLPGWAAFTRTYDQYLDTAKSGDTVVEVGVCFGKSVAYLAAGARARGLNIDIYACDPWAEWIDLAHGGTLWPWPELHVGGPFATFCDQMLKHARSELETIRVLRLRSLQAARIFDDRSLAMVMLDGSHALEDVRADIAAWRGKVRPGGLLAGDDYAPDFPGVVEAVRGSIVGYDVDGTTWRHRVP
jgi:predicted O-methyltransferase YrrM